MDKITNENIKKHIDKLPEVHAFDLDDLNEKMDQEGIEDLSEIKNVYIRTSTNSSSEIILPNTTGEAVFYQEFYGDKKGNIKEYELHESTPGPDGHEQWYIQPAGPSTRIWLEMFVARR